jgi:hypothetical protein
MNTGRQCDFPPSSTEFAEVVCQIGVVASAPTNPSFPAAALHVVDVWHFEYFRAVCTKQFSYYLGTPIWEPLVLQAAATEPCIFYGVLALGSLSRNTVPNRNSGKFILFPGYPVSYSLSKYNMAIQELNKRLQSSPQSWELAVLSSLIFIPIEIMQGHVGMADMHIQGGLAILESHENEFTIDIHKRTSMINVLDAFSRLSIRISTPREPVSLPNLPWPVVPPRFQSTDEARDILNTITGCINGTLQKHGVGNLRRLAPFSQPVLAEKVSFVTEQLDSWKRGFDIYVAEHIADRTHNVCVDILLMYHQVIYIYVSTYFYIGRSAYDTHIREFSHIIELATKILKAPSLTPRPMPQTGRNQMFDIVTIQPLFFVACSCRDGVIRRRAIDIIEGVETECYYNTRLLAQVLRWVVAVEDTSQNLLYDIELDSDGETGLCTITAWAKEDDGPWEEVSHKLLCA